MTFRTTARRYAPFTLGVSPYRKMVASFSPILWLRFNELSGTTVVNYGSAGAALNGVWNLGTTGALDQTDALGIHEAYDFDGHDTNGSRVTVPNTSAHNALAIFTRMCLCKPDNAGPSGGGGGFYFWGGSANNGGMQFTSSASLASLNVTVDTDATNATATGINVALTASQHVLLFVTYNHTTDQTIRVYKYIGGVLSQITGGTTTPGTGNIVTVSGGNAFVVGNRSDNVRGFNGFIGEFATFPTVLTTNNMSAIGALIPGLN